MKFCETGITIYLIAIFWCITLAKPVTKNSRTKPNSRNNDQRMKVLMKVRRQEGPCDYLYEDCDTEEYEYEEVYIGHKNKGQKIEKAKKELHNNMQVENKNLKGASFNNTMAETFEEYLENLDSYSELKPVNIKEKALGPFDKEFVDRAEINTVSTKIWFYEGPPQTQLLPPDVMLCNDESNCRLPFQKHKNLPKKN